MLKNYDNFFVFFKKTIDICSSIMKIYTNKYWWWHSDAQWGL